MDLRTCYLTKNACYISGAKHTPKGIMVHSTGANNKNLCRYVQPDDGFLGKNLYGNHWNQYAPDKVKKCVHAFIGADKNGDVATYQTLPWDMIGWHSGKGSKGTANYKGYIGFEICEDNLSNAAYFNKVYKEAVELCAYLCKEYNLDPLVDGVIICHSEGFKRGIASNHGDVMHWFPKFGKNMNTFRKDVSVLVNGTEKSGSVPDSWARDSVLFAVENGILCGDASGNLKLHNECTRQDMIVFLYRFYQMIKRKM